MEGCCLVDWFIVEVDYLVCMVGRKFWLENDVCIVILLLVNVDKCLKLLVDLLVFLVCVNFVEDI